MGKALITLINPNFVHPPITPYALDILTTSLEQAEFDVEIVDLTFARERWREVLRDHFARSAPMLTGVTVRNTDTIYPQEQRVFLDSHREIIAEVKRHSTAPVVAGGVGFSSMPFALVDYFGVEFGVKGPGEIILTQLAEALFAGRQPDTVPGLIVHRGSEGVHQIPYPAQLPFLGRTTVINRETAYARHSARPDRVDNLAYYRNGGLGNILTKNGCAFSCAHCVEPDAKGSSFTRRPEWAVVDEMEALLGQGVFDLHTTDSEFNLNIAHSKAVLREIVRRKRADRRSPLHRLRLWVYVQPAPFDEEYAALLAEAGCGGINVAPDHVRDEVLDGWKVTGKGRRFYTFDDVRRVCRLAHQHAIPTMVEALLGMPGETEQTLRACVRALQSLNATVVGYTLGIRVFPYSPLGLRLAADSRGVRMPPGVQSNTAIEPIVLKPQQDCANTVQYERQFMFDRHGRFRPVYYFSPDLPEGSSDDPAQRWRRSLELLWDCVPEHERHRVMLPTEVGITPEDNNYADNPFLLRLTSLGYKGAYWSYWPMRDRIMRETVA
jgi:tryptophan 2-C-methyltransferase